MQKIITLLQKNRSFLYPYLFFLIIGLVILFTTKKGDVLLFINSHHNDYLDFYFKYITNLGEGYYFAIIIIIMGLYRVKYFIQGLILFLSTGLTAQLLKQIFDDPRPISYFGDRVLLNLVDGVSVYSWNSFPSGHSTSAFTIFLFFSFLVKNQILKFIFLIIALNVAISRIYLVQHFFVDIYYGSIIGTIMTLIIYHYLENNSTLNSKKWYNYQVFKR